VIPSICPDWSFTSFFFADIITLLLFRSLFLISSRLFLPSSALTQLKTSPAVEVSSAYFHQGSRGRPWPDWWWTPNKVTEIRMHISFLVIFVSDICKCSSQTSLEPADELEDECFLMILMIRVISLHSSRFRVSVGPWCGQAGKCNWWQVS